MKSSGSSAVTRMGFAHRELSGLRLGDPTFYTGGDETEGRSKFRPLAKPISVLPVLGVRPVLPDQGHLDSTLLLAS